MRIAIIGPALSEIPPKGWGACETLIWQYKLALEKLGHQVDIYNGDWLVNIPKINNTDYDFVHVQYDDHVGFIKKNIIHPVIATTHYGYLTQPNIWSGGYWYIHSGVMQSDGIIAISDEIKKRYLEDGYTKPIKVLRNGAEVNSFKFSENPKKDCICVGKIETRKRQTQLANICRGKFNIDFAGPITDHEFEIGGTINYLGELTREELYDRLTEYKTLILVSDGEGAPLVVPEAQAAGLNVVVTQCASANIKNNNPGYTIIPDNFSKNELSAAISNSLDSATPENRKKIRKYAEKYWNWDVIVLEYINEIIPEMLKKIRGKN